MMLISAPAIYDVAKAGAETIEGVKITLRFDLSDGRIAAVHVSPGVEIKDDNAALWRSLDRLLGFQK